MLSVLNKVFDPNKREIKRLEKIADQVEALAIEMDSINRMNNYAAKTEEFKHVIKMVKHLMICLLKHLL